MSAISMKTAPLRLLIVSYVAAFVCGAALFGLGVSAPAAVLSAWLLGAGFALALPLTPVLRRPFIESRR